MSRKAAAAARPGAFLPIKTPPGLMVSYLNSLGVRRYLSSLPIARPSQPPVEVCVPGPDQADDAVGGEDHDQDQDHAVRDGRSGVLDRGGDLLRQPGLARHPLVRPDGKEVGDRKSTRLNSSH